MTKRYLSLLLAAVIIISVFSACSAQNNADDHKLITQTTTELVTDTKSFKLSYTQSDSLNPYKSETLNNQILQTLVFDSLFIVDESYEAQPSIATSYAYTDSTTLEVTVPSGLVFSDKSDITAQSIVYAFEMAKQSPHWKNSLKPISSAYADGANKVIFKLKYANPYAHNLLTFAIAKSTDDKKGYPIGSGRYRFNEGDGEVFIEQNENYKDFAPRFSRIQLVNIASAESIENAINIGNISWAFRDLSDGSQTRMQCNKKAVNLNNFVYIGVNHYTSITANEHIRRAISLAVDRETLVKSSFQGYAKSATSVFNPASLQGKQTAVFSSTADVAAAKQAIVQSGYKESDLKLDILVGSNSNKIAAAQLIKQQLETVGFKVTINQENTKAYQSKIKSRSFDIYIGETKIPDDMSLNSFFSKGGATSSGINLKDSRTAEAYNSYLKGDTEIGRFILEFSEEMPFIPLVYRQGMICYSKSLHGDMQGYMGNYFSNIEDWYCNS